MKKTKFDMYEVHDRIKAFIETIEKGYQALQEERMNAGFEGEKEKHDWLLIDESKFEEVMNHLYDAMYSIEEYFYR